MIMRYDQFLKQTGQLAPMPVQERIYARTGGKKN